MPPSLLTGGKARLSLAYAGGRDVAAPMADVEGVAQVSQIDLWLQSWIVKKQ